MKIIGVKCKDKYYITEVTGSTYSPYKSLATLTINNKAPSSTFQEEWSRVDYIPETVQRTVSQSNINYRYELIDKTMKSKKIPAIIKREDAGQEDSDYDWHWNDKYKMYASMYELKSDKQPNILKDVEFEYETIVEVKEIREYKGFAYDVQRTQWAHEGMVKLTEKHAHHQLIDRIIFPDLVLPATPTALTAEQSYKIIREYIKQHINYAYVTITSDYDFCFTVKKKIPLSESEEYRVDVNSNLFAKRKKKPKWETRYRKAREVEMFNMAPKPYTQYHVVRGFKGKDQEDLKRNIDNYLERLIEFINEPVKDCPHCKGCGVILDTEAPKTEA